MILHQISNEIGLTPINNILTGAITNISSSTQSTILTLSAVTKHKLFKISCSGTVYAKYELFLNTVLIETRRSSPNRTLEFKFDYPFVIQNTDILDIKVTHFYAGNQEDFEATLYSVV